MHVLGSSAISDEMLELIWTQQCSVRVKQCRTSELYVFIVGFREPNKYIEHQNKAMFRNGSFCHF